MIYLSYYGYFPICSDITYSVGAGAGKVEKFKEVVVNKQMLPGYIDQ